MFLRLLLAERSARVTTRTWKSLSSSDRWNPILDAISRQASMKPSIDLLFLIARDLSRSQDHALDQRVRDIGRMSQDGRPLVLRHELGLSADQAVGQGPQLFDKPDIVVARAKVETPLGNRSGWAARGRRRKDREGRIQPIVQLPAGLGAQVDVGVWVLRPALPGVGDRRRDSITRQMVREVAA